MQWQIKLKEGKGEQEYLSMWGLGKSSVGGRGSVCVVLAGNNNNNNNNSKCVGGNDEVAVEVCIVCYSMSVIFRIFIFRYIKDINYLIIHLLKRAQAESITDGYIIGFLFLS